MNNERKQELLKVAKDYQYGIADGLIVSAERAVELLAQHSNIMYIRFTNDEQAAIYDSLAAAADDGVEIERSQKFYI